MAEQRLSLLIFALSAILVTLLLSCLLRIGMRPAGYPPGPPTIPILGNIHQVRDFNIAQRSSMLINRPSDAPA